MSQLQIRFLRARKVDRCRRVLSGATCGSAGGIPNKLLRRRHSQGRTAIAMRTARWTDIPVPIRQAILETATEAVLDFTAGEP